MAPIGLFAQGGRRVRCARCRYEWHVTLPTSIDVVESTAPDMPVSSPPLSSTAPPMPNLGTPTKPPENLPAVIEKKKYITKDALLSAIAVLAAIFMLVTVAINRGIVKIVPGSGIVYEAVINGRPEWDGLVFEDIISELRYDSGTMRLFVDGTIRNKSEDRIDMPDIKACALAADRSIIRSWIADGPVDKLEPGETVPFHTEIASSMERTIQDVSLEFVPRKEKP